MSTLRYLETLQLAERNVAAAPRRRGAVTRGMPDPAAAPAAAIPAALQAAVDAGSLLSFVDGVSAQQKDDVLYSVQLAQRGASGAFDRFSAAESWYRKYTEILEALGWTAEQMAFARYDQSQGEFRMDKAALAIITAIASQNQLAVLGESIKALESLAQEDGTIRLFDFHSSAQSSGNFQIGAAQVSANGALALALGAFHYSGTDASRRVLFAKWGAQSVNFWTAAQKMTLNDHLYAQHRDAVEAKLGVAAGDFIAGLTLG
jgi:hypothetical protein